MQALSLPKCDVLRRLLSPVPVVYHGVFVVMGLASAVVIVSIFFDEASSLSLRVLLLHFITLWHLLMSIGLIGDTRRHPSNDSINYLEVANCSTAASPLWCMLACLQSYD
jgi:hypothetical protein